jgi:AmpE protein
MKFLVIILCLLMERFLAKQLDLKRFQWFSTYANYMEKLLSFLNSLPVALLGALILPLVFIIGCVTYLVNGLMFGIVGLLINVVIVYYCFGPINVFYPIIDEYIDKDVGEYLVDANEQLFGALFWYLCFGVVGIVTYRLLSLCKKYIPVAKIATVVFDVANWIPVRITSICYLLVGNFQHGVSLFLQKIIAAPSENSQMLSQCGLAALDSGRGEPITIGHAQTHVEHATLLWVFLLAIYTFIV